MLLFAMSDALSTTIVNVLIWGVLFPAFVTALIIYALVIGRGESEANKEQRRFPRL